MVKIMEFVENDKMSKRVFYKDVESYNPNKICVSTIIGIVSSIPAYKNNKFIGYRVINIDNMYIGNALKYIKNQNIAYITNHDDEIIGIARL